METALELWVSLLREVKQRIQPLFLQERMAQGCFGMRGSGRSDARRGGWERKRRAIRVPGASRPSLVALAGMPMLLRDVVRDYVVETLSDAVAVLVIDETGFLKQGCP